MFWPELLDEELLDEELLDEELLEEELLDEELLEELLLEELDEELLEDEDPEGFGSAPQAKRPKLNTEGTSHLNTGVVPRRQKLENMITPLVIERFAPVFVIILEATRTKWQQQ